MLTAVAYIQSVEEVVFRLFVLQKQLKILKNLLRNHHSFIKNAIIYTYS